MSPIINHQAVGYLLAEVAARIEACRYMCWTAAEIFIVAMIALSAVVAGYASIRRLLAPQPIAWAPTPPSAVTVIFGRVVVGCTSKVPLHQVRRALSKLYPLLVKGHFRPSGR